MNNNSSRDSGEDSFQIAQRWCSARGDGWNVQEEAGRGGTAPVYSLHTPHGERALKIYDEYFSSGPEGEIQLERVKLQIELGDHACNSLVKVYDGGEFEGRLFVLMSLAPGGELEKRLPHIPKDKIRGIIDQVTKAVIFLEEKGLCHRDIKSANIFISDDYNTATLLDVSVLRKIHCPVGLGTDHGNQLPMIATARYSPPEYLFRLLEPDTESWHALNIYQLGGVLHDLIMGEQLFEEQFRIAGDNRYRFAWAVATIAPHISAEGVDLDLIDLARRSLEKDWRKRSEIKLTDFLSDAPARKANSLRLLGLSPKQESAGGTSSKVPARILRPVTEQIDAALSAKLLKDGARPTHKVELSVMPPQSTIKLAWQVPASLPGESGDAEYVINVTGQNTSDGAIYAMDASLELSSSQGRVRAEGSAPPLADGANLVPEAVSALFELLGSLAMRISSADGGATEGEG